MEAVTNKEEILSALLNPKSTISKCQRLKYVDAAVAEQAARLIRELSEEINYYRENMPGV